MYLNTIAIIQAVVYAGQTSAAAAAGSDQSPSTDGLNKTISALQDLLLPGDDTEKKERAERAKRIMEEEINKGPFKVEGMVYNKSKRKR